MLALVAALTAGIWFAIPLSGRAAGDSQAEQLHRYMALASAFGFSGSVLVARNGTPHRPNALQLKNVRGDVYTLKRQAETASVPAR